MGALPKRVLILIESGPLIPYWVDAIGSLLRRGMSITLASVQSRGPLHDACEAIGAQTVAFGNRGVAGYPSVVRHLSSVLRQHDIELVHAVGPIPAALAGMAGVRVRGAIRIFHRHHVASEGVRGFVWLAGRLSDVQMAVSEAASRRATEEGLVDPARIVVARNGSPRPAPFDADQLGGFKASLGIPAEHRIISLVARLRPVKGVDVAIRAMEELARFVTEPVQLLIVGEGAVRARLERQARAVNASIRFFGHQTDPSPWLAVADVVVVPSRRESFGLVAIEAMALGRPVVASSVDGLRETVEDGVSGILVPPDDPVRLAEAVAAVLRDSHLSMRLCASGLDRYERYFTVDAMVDRWLAGYETALSLGRRGRGLSGGDIRLPGSHTDP